MTVSGVFAFREWIRKISRDASPHGQEAEQTPTEQKAVQTESPNSEEAFKRLRTLLGSSCDLQIVTGLGILISGWSQLPDIEYYHEQLVLLY